MSAGAITFMALAWGIIIISVIVSLSQLIKYSK